MTTFGYIALIFAGIIVYFVLAARKMKKMPVVPDNKHVITLTQQNFKSVTQNGIVLVDFWAAWCMPCKMMAPILNEIAEETAGDAKICKLNIEEQQALANTFKVRSIPTMILFKNGKEVDRVVGVKTKDFLINKIERAKIA